MVGSSARPYPAPDWIFTYGLHSERIRVSHEAFDRFPQSYWIASDPISWYGPRLLRSGGVVPDRFEAPNSLKNTWEESWFLYERIRMARAEGEGPRTIWLVSSPAHLGRIRMLWEHKFSPLPGVMLVYVPAGESEASLDERVGHWWGSRELRVELFKYLWYWLRY